MDIFELNTACNTLFGRGLSSRGMTRLLAGLCKCSEATVRKWKSRGEVPAMASELIRVKVLAKEISER